MLSFEKYQEKLDTKRNIISSTREDRLILNVEYMGRYNKWKADVISSRTTGNCDEIGSVASVFGYDDPLKAAEEVVEKALRKADTIFKYKPNHVVFIGSK